MEHLQFSLRLVGAIFLLAFGGLVTFANWRCFWLSHVRRVHSPSWTPLMGGVLMAIGVLLLPFRRLHPWAWVPLLLDWGSVPGLIETVAFYSWLYWKNKKRR